MLDELSQEELQQRDAATSRFETLVYFVCGRLGMFGDELATQRGSDDKLKLAKAVQDALRWLGATRNAEKCEFHHQADGA